jgi:hypothetical protein
MSQNIEETFVIEPLTYEPTVGAKVGRFIDMRWETDPNRNGTPRKDLVLVTELVDDSGQTVQVPRAFNMLPRGRGKSDFKKQMESFLETPLTKAQLAGLKKTMVVGKPVIMNYKKDHLGHVVFDKFAPVKLTPSEAASTKP